MNLNINCPGCGQPLVVDAAAAGQPTRCSKCATAFLVPGGAGGGGPFPGPDTRKSGMATTSLVLGILSLPTFCMLLGIPAIILGHIGLNRTKKFPAQYTGGGMAIAGLVTGYVSLALSFFVLPVMLAMLLPALAAAKNKAQAINSKNNLKQVGLAFHIWEGDHNGQYPFNVSQAQGGTRELCQQDANGYEQNPAPTFKVLANALGLPNLLVCPGDPVKHPAASFASLTADNISYQLRTGPEINDQNPQAVLMVDPINGVVLHCDGTAEINRQYKTKRF